MATSTQTEEYLSVNDLPHLLNMMSEISPGCTIFNFGLQLGVRHSKIEEFKIEHNNKQGDILREILYEALKLCPRLTKKEIVKALRANSVQEYRLANQIEANYIPQSQRGPQHVGPGSLPIAQTGHPQQLSFQSAHQLPPSAPLHQTLTNIQPPPWPNTSQLFASHQLTTELPRTNQPQSNLDQVGQSHQLPASLSMAPPPAPQTSQSVSLQPQPGPSVTSLQWTPELQHLLQLPPTYQPPPSAPPYFTPRNIPQTSNKFQPPPSPNTSHLFDSQQLSTDLPRADQPPPNLHQVGQSHCQSASLEPQPTPQTSQTVFLQPQPGPSLTSLQMTPQMPTIHRLTPFAPPQTNIMLQSLTQPSPWAEHSQLAASQQLTPDVPRPDQTQPNPGGQSHQLQTGSLHPQPGSSFISSQRVPQLQGRPLLFPPNHSSYPLPPVANHRPPESQSFPTHDQQSSHSYYSSFQPSHDQHSSITQPRHDHYCSFTQPSNNQYTFSRPSHDLKYFQSSHHTPYQQDQGHQSHQFQWQSSSQPPSQHHHSPVFPSQHFHTSDTNLPQTQERQSSPAPTFAATSESTPFLELSPSPRQQPSPSSRQQPSPSPRQQPSPSPRQQPSPSPRQQPSLLPREQPSPSPRQQPSPSPRQQPSPSPRQQPSLLPRQQPSPSPRQQPSPSPRQQPSPLPRQQPSPSRRQQPSPLPRQPSPSPRQQPSPSPRQQPIPVSIAGSPAPPPAKRLRQQSPSPPFHSSPASEATASTAGYPPHVHDFISFVKTTYSAQKVLRDEKWSLSPTVKFINLACIDRKSVKSKEYSNVTKAMVMDGNVDAIKETKGPIKFSEIAKGISLPSSGSEQENDRRLILVEGAPGVGKSTFAWEFCRKWMNAEIVQQYHLVLLLRLRDKRIREAKNLKDLFFNPSRSEESLAVYNELKNSQQFHALIILEGYDELPDSCRNDPLSVFNELISGKLLPLATVLVTSRPWATKDLHEQHACHIYQHIEVLGFTKKQIKEYINKNVGEEKVRSGLNLYLEKHPQIRSGMYIPLNSAIVVAVYKDSIENDRQTLPNTITELYSCCIEILIRRHLKRNTGLRGGNEMSLPAINLSVPSDVHRNFVHMCHLAFSGIVEATEVKLIFSESELPEHFDNLGFMDSVTDLYVTGETVSSHNFLHLTFQEFFAAVHISTMSKEQQLQYFIEGKSDSGSKGGRLNVVLKFLAGLQKLDCFTNDTVNLIVDTPSPGSSYLTPSDITVGVAVINWLFEAQSETAMSLILGERKVEFKASKSQMSPMDYYSLGYCISHSQCQWVLSLEGRMEISMEKIKMLLDGARDVTGGGKVVEFGDDALSHLRRDKLDLLFTEWNNILCLQKLSIEGEATVWPDFSELRELEFHLLANKSIEFLIPFIKKVRSLRKFTMSMAENALESAHKLLELVQTLDHHPTLQEKSVKGLECTVTTDVDVNALSQLCSNNFVSMSTHFIKYVGGLSDDGVVVLAEILQHKYRSGELNLSRGGTSDDGTVSLANALHHNSTIHTLKLWGNRISDDGAVALAEALLKNQSLQELYLYGNDGIGDRPTGKFVEALTQNSSINVVYLPARCREYATKCPNYHQVQAKLHFI